MLLLLHCAAAVPTTYSVCHVEKLGCARHVRVRPDPMVMDNLPADVASLSELSDSSILRCLEDRFRNNRCQSYVGQVLMSVDPQWPTLRGTSQAVLLAPEFAASVLHSASVMREDQSVVLCGYPGSGKTVVLHQLLGSLVAGLESSKLQQKVMDAMWLLQAVTSHSGNTQDGLSIVSGNQAVVGVRLFLKHHELLGSAFSCVLLNTTDLCHFSVFELNGVREKLESVGVSSAAAAQFTTLLVELDLLSEGRVSNLLTVSENMDKAERKQLAEQLYAHLVYWLVCYLNMELAPPTTDDGYCHVDIFDPPGVTTHDESSKPGNLVQLTQQYVNEVFHNVYCHRLFIWEQEQYIEDDLEWEFVHVQTNQLLIEAFQASGGVLDAVSVGGARDLSAAVTRSCLAHPDVCFTTEEESMFIFSHFTGEMCYAITEEWSETNSVHISQSQDVLQSLLSSSTDLVRQLAESMSGFSPDCLFSVCWEGKLTLASRLKQTTQSLMELVTTSRPHFVLCLSPHSNRTDKVTDVDCDYMLAQLQHFRVLDTALIQSCGYPVHLEHRAFAERYSSILIGDRGSMKDGSGPKDICEAVLSHMTLTDYKIGNTQVFLKPWHLRQLESELELIELSARKLQQAFRRSCLQHRSERLKLESVVKDVLQERDEYDVVSTDSGSGGEEDPEKINGDLDEVHPPSPPPRPQHTLSKQSFAIDGERLDKICLLPNTPLLKVPKERPTGSSADSVQSQRSWYHGKISRDGAERCLKAVSFDCFLVRESEKRPGEYSLSLKHKTIVKHFRVDVKRGSRARFELFGSQKSFPSLIDLIDYYTRHCITTAGETLTAPCPIEGTNEDTPPPLPPPRRKNLSSIRRKEPPPTARTQHATRSRTPTTPLIRARTGPETRSASVVSSFDLSDESVEMLLKELQIEERIVDAARRMADMPGGNRKEKQQRRRSLQQAQSRLLSLRQQYHTIQERRRFIEVAMNNIPSSNRRISVPNFNTVQ